MSAIPDFKAYNQGHSQGWHQGWRAHDRYLDRAFAACVIDESTLSRIREFIEECESASAKAVQDIPGESPLEWSMRNGIEEF